MKRSEGERRGWILVAVFLLIGLLCVFVAGDLAIRFAPRWTLQADMRSRLDANSAYFTAQPNFVLPPLDPAILTPPVWINVFLTPGQNIPTRLPGPTATATQPLPTQVPSTKILSTTPTSTGTFIYFTPTRLSTSNPAFTRTATSIPSRTPTLNATATKTATPMRTFTSTSTGTATNTATATGTYTATSMPSLTATVTSTFTATSTPTSTATPTNTPRPEADLQITIDDNASSYDANANVQYTIVVSNLAGPSAAIGAPVSSSFSANLANVTWTCAGSGGASCMGSGSGNIVDNVNLPPGTSVSYWVSAQVISSPNGNLTSSVTVNPPVGISDPNTFNNQAADTDQLVVASSLPYGNIDPVKNGTIEFVPTNTTVTLQFVSPLNVGSHAGADLIYYEWPQGDNPGIWMDCVILQLGDGRNWYTILNWGDNKVDTNASMNMSTIGVSAETDNIIVPAPFMYDLTGVALELDGVVPSGSYKYIRIISPAAPQDGPAPNAPDGVEIDALYIVP